MASDVTRAIGTCCFGPRSQLTIVKASEASIASIRLQRRNESMASIRGGILGSCIPAQGFGGGTVTP